MEFVSDFWTPEHQRLRNMEEEDGNFNNYKSLLEQHRHLIIKLGRALEGQTISIYGEVFGGSYNHADVDRDAVAIKVKASTA